MTLFWIIPGLALPTVIGWLIVRLFEGKTPVLFKWERWILGFVLGLTFTMFITFLAHVTTGIQLNRMGYMSIQLLLIIVLGLAWKVKSEKLKVKSSNLELGTWNLELSLPRSIKIIISVFMVWTIIKILSTGITFLILTPPFQGDTVDNWNLRGKIFFSEQEIVLAYPNPKGELVTGEINTYPPSVPMVKSSLATIAGIWSEPLVNIVHLLWYLAAIALLFFSLRRVTTLLWSLGGAYLLASLPLYLMHGTNPYADVYLSVHIFAAISMLFHAIATDDSNQRRSFLRLSAFATALLPFTKNEALIIHTPTILLILVVVLWWMKRKRTMSGKECVQTFIWYASLLAAIAIPWIAFKWINDLTFGNAKSISDIAISWQPGVLKAITMNTFFEGNWLLLFPLVFFLLIIKRRIAFKTPLVVLTGFFLIVYLGQFPLYMFTYLSTEALYQTGYARGLIHLTPVIVMIVCLLLAKCMPVKSERLKVKS